MDDIPIPHSFYPFSCLLSASLLTIQNAHTLPSPHSLVHLLKNRQAAAYDGFTEIAGGCFFDGNWRQLGVQVAEAVIGFVWSFVGSHVLYALVDCIPGIEVFATDEYVIFFPAVLVFFYGGLFS